MVQIKSSTATRQPPMKELQQRGHTPAHAWRTLSFKSARQFTTLLSPCLLSPCSHLSRCLTSLKLRSPKTNHLDHQHLLHTGKIIPRLLAPPHRYNSPPNRGVLHGPGQSDHEMRGEAKHVNSTNRISPEMPQMVTWDRHNPCPVARTWQDGQRGKGVIGGGG